MGAESTVTLRAVLRDEISAALKIALATAREEADKLGQSGSAAGERMSSGMSTALPTVRGVTDALGQQVAALRAQAAAMSTPEYKAYAQQQQTLKGEIERLTEANSGQGVSWTAVASKVFLAQQALQMVYGPMMAIVGAAKEYDSIRVRLTQTEGSGLVADKDLATLREMAKLPGLGFGEAAQRFSGLRALRVQADEAFGIIEGLAKANAAMGGGAEQFSRVMYQLQQGIGKGKIMAEDMNNIKEAIPNLGNIIEQSFGTMDNEKINKKLAETGRTVKDFWIEIAEAAKKLPPAADTIQNNMDNMGDAWKRLQISLADADGIKTATGMLAAFIESIAKGRERINSREALDERTSEQLGKREWATGEHFEGNVLDRAQRGIMNFFGTGGQTIAPQVAGGSLAGMGSVGFSSDFARMQAGIQTTDVWYTAWQERQKKEGEQKLDDEAKSRRLKEQNEAAAEKARAEATRIRKHNEESALNVDAQGNLIAGRGIAGQNVQTQITQMGKRDVDKDRQEVAKRHTDALKDIDETRKIYNKGQLDELKDFERTEKRKSEVMKRELAVKLAAYHKYADQVQGFAQKELASALRGEFSVTEARRAALELGTNMIAQYATEWLAKQAEMAIFGDAIKAAKMQEDTAMRAALLVESATAAAATAGFWATPAALVDIASGGSLALTEPARMAEMMAAVQAVSMVPAHANGGFEMGNRFIAGERGREEVRTVAPTQIYQNSQTTNNHGGPVHIHIHGGDQSTILRTIRKATTNGAQVSR